METGAHHSQFKRRCYDSTSIEGILLSVCILATVEKISGSTSINIIKIMHSIRARDISNFFAEPEGWKSLRKKNELMGFEPATC